MKSRFKAHFIKILPVLAGGALAVSVIWCRPPGARETRIAPLAASGADYPPVSIPPEVPPGEWHPPITQKAGAGWIYELFSPPAICRDPLTGALVVQAANPADSSSPNAGVKLLSVRSAPYRVQLQGYFGHSGDYVAVLMAVATRELWYGHPGDQWTAQGITLRQLDVVEDRSGAGARTAGGEAAARAVLWDARSGAETIVEAGYRTLTSEPVAVVQLTGSPAIRELRAGDSWVAGENTYRLESVIQNPAQASVSQTGGTSPRTLLLRTGSGAEQNRAAGAQPALTRPPL